MFYKVEFRDELGNITSKDFMTYEASEKYYYNVQMKFEAIEMRWLGPDGVIDHCYLVGSKFKPIWLGD